MPAIPFTLDDPLVNIFEEHEPMTKDKKDYSSLSKCFKIVLSS